ncbi:CVNH domain-containing protein [Aspergillus alliaceus]|uniref:CVNH domain-containing protein n=1 Tax=Petromyces alliaceus TaxID=209559 RepID=A0A5N6FI72_PETAA|nr:CVNH domain-containing protein [Aspergillus alliaceus]KAB8229621.1 CVNH domain-containing protein [Aspergillus alliaceus]KAE8389028.1 CVNH domain-containing protein [Aspergillus alliaceus]
MTMREYASGDQNAPTSYDNNNNHPYPPQNNRPPNLSSQSFSPPNSSGYYPYPPPGINPTENNYNYNYNQSYPAPSECPRPHSPYQPQPWAQPSPSPSNYYQQSGGESYQSAPSVGQPPYPSYENSRPNQSNPYPPQPFSPSPQPGYAQQPPAPPPYSPQPTDSPNAVPDEKDRGFLGAVAGGATGAYAGHKVNHGFLGAIGGAMTGSVAQDAMRKHKEKKEEEERRKIQQQQQQQQQQWAMAHQNQPPPPPFNSRPPPAEYHKPVEPMRGNFSLSSRDICLEGNDLVAHCGAISGHMRRSSIPLNNVLSNHFGKFVWARGGNFGASARNVRLIEGGKVLEAELADGQGGWNRSWMKLDERISNQDGNLVFLD